MNVDIVESPDEVESIALEWEALLISSTCNRGFSSPWWFLAACRSDPDISPRVITLRRGSTLAGVLPLVLVAGKKEAQFASSMANYNDVVVAGNDLDAATALLACAAQSHHPWRLLNLPWIRNSANLRLAAIELWGARTGGRFTSSREYLFVRLPSDYGDYLGTRSRMFRKGLSRARRKCADQGLEIQELSPQSYAPSEIVETFLRLHLARFGDNSAFAKSRVNESTARLAIPALFARQHIRVFGLVRGREILGIDISFVGPESLCTWNGGYAPESECWSPGSLLIDTGIRTAITMGLKEYDLLRGTQQWKTRWANASREVGTMTIEVGT